MAKKISCGCCTNGCVCFMHRDIPRGIIDGTCDIHACVGFRMRRCACGKVSSVSDSRCNQCIARDSHIPTQTN